MNRVIIPLRFICVPIDVYFDVSPTLEKKTGCPDRFSWEEETHQIVEIISEWHNYQRRGRMAKNMRPEHAKTAERRGSWGVGEDYYRVRTDEGRLFDIYYDRAPKDINHRKGAWFLDKELTYVD
jgi:hypothetical protein